MQVSPVLEWIEADVNRADEQTETYVDVADEQIEGDVSNLFQIEQIRSEL